MHLRLNQIAILLLAILFVSCSTEESRVKNLIPKPVEAQESNGSFLMNAQTTIVLGSNSQDLLKLGNYARLFVHEAAGWQLPIGQTTSATNVINLKLSPEVNTGDEEYELLVEKNGVTISASKPAGIFYALQTLKQLMPVKLKAPTDSATDLDIPFCHIKDKPRFAYRGSMLDVARHFFGVEDVKRYIDLIAYYKMNTLHLGLTNDQGWRIEIKSWPELTRIGGSSSVNGDRPGFYTQEQYKDIVRYAQERFITIIPEIDMPGHTNAALASYAILNCNDTATALYTGIEVGFSSFCIHKDITYKFVDDVIRELSEITPGPYIHIGGDESHSTKKEDYQYFVERAAIIVKNHGKQPMGWDEVATAKLPPNSITQFWDNTSNAKTAVQQKSKLVMSPAKKAYLDMQYDSTSKLGLHWAAYVEIDSSYQWDPATYIPGISEQHILGVEAPLWSETLSSMEDIEYMAFPRLPGIAEIAWSPAANRHWDEYKLRLAHHGKAMKALGIDFYQSKQIPWK